MEKLPIFPEFDPENDKTNVGKRFRKWTDRLENLFLAINLTDDARQRALMLHYAGEVTHDAYVANKPAAEPADGEKYTKAKDTLLKIFEPKKNELIAEHEFTLCKQKDGQTFDEYVTELKLLAKRCTFTDNKSRIRSQLISNCKSTQLRRRIFRDPEKYADLDVVIELGRSIDAADKYTAQVERDQGFVNAIIDKQPQRCSRSENREHKNKDREKYSRDSNSKHRYNQRQRSKSRHRYNSNTKHKPQNRPSNTCYKCGGIWPHRTRCPASGRSCNNCGKQNHFAEMCFHKKTTGKPIHKVTRTDDNNDATSSSEDEYCYSVSTRGKPKSPKLSLKLNGKAVETLIDTGASVNILDEATHKRIGSPKLKYKSTNLAPYGGGTPIHTIGTLHLNVESKHKYQICKFHVVKGNHGTLIGYETATQLNLVKIINRVTEDPLSKYPEVIKGIGKLKTHQVKIHIDPRIPPVAQRSRRTPFHLRKKVENELEKLLNDDIIEKVNGTPTPWVSPIVTPPKKNPEEIRLCIDMREANKAIIRERHVMPTLEELIHDLNGSQIFSKLDLKSGYHQLELEEESRYITTFCTHNGIYRYKRLNFGISSASEIFQEAISQVIQNVQNAKNISDDIIVFGKTQNEHDKALDETFKALAHAGLTVNKKKCEFNKKQITFFGMVFNGNGVSPDPEKTKAVQEAAAPSSVKELRSFLGMTSYNSRFIQNYATISEPLRKLTHKDTEWVWTERHVEAFETLKQKLSENTTNAYFDPKKQIEIICDASPVGLGAMLTQNARVVAYASRSLTDTETRYSQTEREALGIVWACEHFDTYIRGAQKFTVITDHKPLERIWEKAKPTLRIERWGLRLQPYNVEIKYRPGEENSADYLSRHPTTYTAISSHEQTVAEYYVNFIAETSTPKAMTLDEIKRATNEDATLTKAIEFTRSGQWHKMKDINDNNVDMTELSTLRTVRDELTIHTDNVLLRDKRIVIPKLLRDTAIKIAHEGHQGITKTKSFIRSKIWFPNMNEEVEKRIEKCVACQATGKAKKQREPLKMSPLPASAWENLSADFCGPLPTGDYLFVIIDEYTRYPIVEIVKSTSANATIPVLDKIISIFGIPQTIKTDNGSPFNSSQFAKYAENIGFQHRKITPCWPRANAQAESFNKPLMKVIRSAHIESKNWKQEMHRFLRQYRTTPHSSTGFTPYTLLFNRESRTKLPSVRRENNIDRRTHEALQNNDEHSKYYMKVREDNRIKAKAQTKDVGDNVLLQSEEKGKLITSYNPKPYKIVAKKGSMITAERGERRITRDTSRFKKVRFDIKADNCENDDVDEIAISEQTKADNEHSQKHTPGESQLRKSNRARKTPGYLKDYVCN